MNLFSIKAWTRSIFIERVAGNWACNSLIKGDWQVSNQGSVKVNVDSSVSTFKSRAAIGEVVRKLNGNWMGDLEILVGLSDIFQIEARALLEGLKFAWEKRCRRVEIESDNSVLVTIIQNGLAANDIYSEVRLIQPILRKSNRVTDRIAKEVRDEIEHLIIHKEPPESVRGLLDYDNRCATYLLFDSD
ncbi:hypothetical protein J1N35_008731 [Gossypium stocksii]|uniref:RNase H type-1 domain-containing protein n=1 Tax=Gossypium stocksii TaxID=47602 RepID=A0A9D3WAU9_9ROSI|nr:hypothetical protein J1N35_008731 [Gossypium stocksii]